MAGIASVDRRPVRAVICLLRMAILDVQWAQHSWASAIGSAAYIGLLAMAASFGSAATLCQLILGFIFS